MLPRENVLTIECQEVRFGVYLVHIRMFHSYIYHDNLLRFKSRDLNGSLAVCG